MCGLQSFQASCLSDATSEKPLTGARKSSLFAKEAGLGGRYQQREVDGGSHWWWVPPEKLLATAGARKFGDVNPRTRPSRAAPCALRSRQ
jgi:hypothetical protein